jgi:23S rRNA-/tRNA-specific pseudouridylate synthase
MTGNPSLNPILRNMDTIERIVHWHEPPVSVPEKIILTKHVSPDELFLPRKNTLSTNEARPNGENSPLLYCINKPTSVPVYPAGPYYANSLLLMVEAQENLTPMSLIPCHRIDRCTSGVLLCTHNPDVARVIQGVMSDSASSDSGKSSAIKKLYLARVKGKFPHSSSKIFDSLTLDDSASVVSSTWHGNTLEVSAPIAVKLSDYARHSGDTNKADEEASSMMHRIVSPDGKHAISRFQLISYDPSTDLSLVSCCPITGRGHQLRVHLQAIGFPIHNDVVYGGEIDADKSIKQETISIQSMLHVSMSSYIHDKSITTEEARAAVTMCRCCSDREDGVKFSFQTAQLLGGGHMIDLHAYKYSISIKHEQSSNNEEGAIFMEFIAALPNWALTFEGVSPEDINWIK